MSLFLKRSQYVTAVQKKALESIMASKPLLVGGKFSSTFTKLDARNEWCDIARSLNAIPGAKKSWMQWRKTWQDFRSKAKKQNRQIIPELKKDESTIDDSTEINKVYDSDPLVNTETFVEFTIPETNGIENEETADLEPNAEYITIQTTYSQSEPPPPNPVTKQKDHNYTELSAPTSVSERTTNRSRENNVFERYSEHLLRVAEEKLEMKKEYYSAKLNILKEAKQKDSFENKMLDMAEENNRILNNIHTKLNMILEKLENK